MPGGKIKIVSALVCAVAVACALLDLGGCALFWPRDFHDLSQLPQSMSLELQNRFNADEIVTVQWAGKDHGNRWWAVVDHSPRGVTDSDERLLLVRQPSGWQRVGGWGGFIGGMLADDYKAMKAKVPAEIWATVSEKFPPRVIGGQTTTTPNPIGPSAPSSPSSAATSPGP